jgi:hypothetical protein
MLARLDAIEIIQGTAADIDDRRPLRVSVHHALYQRRCFRPTWLYLSRFAGRDS